MTQNIAVQIVTRDRCLVAALDEPLRRRNIHTEWRQKLYPREAHSHGSHKRLLIVDLDLPEFAEQHIPLEQLATAGTRMLIIPSEKTRRPEAIPPGTIMLNDRSTRQLVEAVRRTLGYPERVFRRRPFEASVQVRPQDANSFTARSCDLSSGGVFIESERSVPPGQRVTVRFVDESGRTELACEGCVAWQRAARHGSQTSYGAGIQFLFPDRQRLDQMLSAHPL